MNSINTGTGVHINIFLLVRTQVYEHAPPPPPINALKDVSQKEPSAINYCYNLNAWCTLLRARVHNMPIYARQIILKIILHVQNIVVIYLYAITRYVQIPRIRF